MLCLAPNAYTQHRHVRNQKKRSNKKKTTEGWSIGGKAATLLDILRLVLGNWFRYSLTRGGGQTRKKGGTWTMKATARA